MAPRKPKAPKAPKAPEAPKPTAASKAKDAEDKPHVYRADLGESLPPQAPHPGNTK
jgi:hypothetical protein